MRREKTAGAAKRRMAFQYAAGGMPDDRGPSHVRFGGGGICAREPPLVGLPKPGAVGPAGRSASGDSFEYEAQLLLGDDVVESKAVEIDTYLFFTNDVVTRPQEEYTIRVRARWIMIVGDPDGQYMVADVGEANRPCSTAIPKHDAAQHWQACSCGERLNVANHRPCQENHLRDGGGRREGHDPQADRQDGTVEGVLLQESDGTASAGQSAGAAGRDDRPQAFGSGYGDG